MEKNPAPGITFKKILLLECSAGNIVDDVPDLVFGVGITELVREISDDGGTLSVVVGFDLMHGIEKPACSFTCKYKAIYTRPQTATMTWDGLKDHIIVAHVYPFLREFICNVTLRMPVKELMIPPINTTSLVQDYLARRAAETGSAVPTGG